MLFQRFRRQAPKKPISARTINAPLDAVETALKMAVSAPLELSSSPMGSLLSTSPPQTLWATIQTGTGLGPYSWYEAMPISGGGWGTGWQGGTLTKDPAYNSLNYTPPLPIIVLLTRDAWGNWRFTCGSC
jgi:hypothetical protein